MRYLDDKEIQIELTLDGSNTLYVPSFEEHYHSVNGAIQESNHVFIDAGFSKIDKNSLNIFEVGFGTGLNSILTYMKAQQENKVVNYTTIEKYPLSIDLINKLNYTSKITALDKEIYSKIHTSDWQVNIAISDNFTLRKLQCDLINLDLDIEHQFDLIYFDAFAPDKQPEMWTNEVFEYLYGNTSPGGVLTTYCAKGSVRRLLQNVGYTVERLAGPPGKREMLRATKIN